MAMSNFGQIQLLHCYSPKPVKQSLLMQMGPCHILRYQTNAVRPEDRLIGSPTRQRSVEKDYVMSVTAESARCPSTPHPTPSTPQTCPPLSLRLLSFLLP